MIKPWSISSTPALKPSEDYLFLRQRGLAYIEQMGSASWTDYNIHDPGITLLELLCYAITDVGYRTGFDLKDLVAEALQKGGYDQAFFTAREILTSHPVTITDFRKLLIDTLGVRNAWLLEKECRCGALFFASCAESTLIYTPTEHRIVPKGYYDVYLELETDEKLGDLNQGKVMHRFAFFDEKGSYDALIEARFPAYNSLPRDQSVFQHWFTETTAISSVVVTALTDRNGVALTEASFYRAIRETVYASWEIHVDSTSDPIRLSRVPITLFFRHDRSRLALTLARLQEELAFAQESVMIGGDVYGRVDGVVALYRRKLLTVASLLGDIRQKLHQHRNLDEDYCRILPVQVEEIALCADVDLTPEADIERVQAEFYYLTTRYFSPPVRFYSLQELLQQGYSPEDFFNGPALDHGFLRTDEVEESGLKSEVHTSDLINLFMDVEGVVAVRNVLLTRYNEQGQPQLPSAPWTLAVTPGHQPRFYKERSKLLFFKNGLPFLPADPDEVDALFHEFAGALDPRRLAIDENDLLLPVGVFRNLADYFPVQYSLPRTYGVGYEGLPPEASLQRQVAARQLKAYLLLFEQQLANLLNQLQHLPNLFSLQRTTPIQTVYTRFIDNALIKDIEEVYDSFGADNLQQLAETEPMAYERRNQFLDHLLARFGEQLTEYSLLYTRRNGKPRDQAEVVNDKISLLKNYPVLSSQRARAFNYLDPRNVCGFQNVSGLSKRLIALLGLDSLRNYLDTRVTQENDSYAASFELDGNRLRLFPQLTATTRTAVTRLLGNRLEDVLAFGGDPARYRLIELEGQWYYELVDTVNERVGIGPALASQAQATAALDDLLAWVSQVRQEEKMVVVEHLLLAPRMPGQLLLPVCLSPDCDHCGADDPYSYRLTLVMPGWMDRFSDLDFRRFAERTIYREVPAHLLPKICWVGNDICRTIGNQSILCDIQEVLNGFLLEEDPEGLRKTELCRCAETILIRYNEVFRDWTATDEFDTLSAQERGKQARAKLREILQSDELACRLLLKPEFAEAVENLTVSYFLAHTDCFQFTLFRKAWCRFLTTQAAIDWTLPDLSDRLERLFSSANCACLETLLASLGESIRGWLNDHFQQPMEADDWVGQLTSWVQTAWDTAQVTACTGLALDQQQLIDSVTEYYRDKLDFMQAHAALITVFGQLKSVYPPATLHDCIDGNDDNPVRLNTTVLG